MCPESVDDDRKWVGSNFWQIRFARKNNRKDQPFHRRFKLRIDAGTISTGIHSGFERVDK
jgi:hypothetical protein